MAHRPETEALSLGEKLAEIPKLAQTIFAALIRAVTFPFVGGAKANTYYKDVVFAALRKHFALATLRQEALTTGTTEISYLNFAKEKQFQPDTDVLESGTKVHWLGSKSAERTILYLHGGGFVLAAHQGQFRWFFDLQEEISKDRSVAVAVVSYTLAPGGQYPKQLQQCVEALAWLIKQGKKPSNIMLAGDSAGGNLVLAVLSHILHPHPKLPQDLKINLSEPLATALLISPWVKFTAFNDESFKRNENSDMTEKKTGERWRDAYLGKAPYDEYNEATSADGSWFKGLDRVVKDIMIWGGGAECLIDSIEENARTIKAAHPRTEVIVQSGCAHTDFLLDRMLGYTSKHEATEIVERWLVGKL